MKTKIWIVIAAFALLAGCVSEIKPLESTEKTSNPFEGLFEQHARVNGMSVNASTKVFEKYGIINEKDILKNLPTKTKTFGEKQQWMKGGEGVSLGEVDENDYKQPDFYPAFKTSGKNTWINATGEKPFVIGVMSTPADQEATLTSESGEFETYLFVGAGWGTTTHQGVGLRAMVEPAEKGINVSISPNEFVVGPAFPIIDENWMERVHVEGNVSSEVKEGVYTITILLNDPSEEKENEWAKKYGDYARANSTFVDARGIATLTLTIPPKSKEN